jgi:hypothetical protein
LTLNVVDQAMALPNKEAQEEFFAEIELPIY